MTKGRAAKALKQGRILASQTQLQLSFDTNLTREAVSQYETGRTRVQPDICQHFIRNFNNPWIALESADEYIGWGVRRLDGLATDLHRSSVKDKALEELDEAIRALSSVKTSVHPDYVESFQREDIEKSVQEMQDVVTASITWIAIACEEYNFNWQEQWDRHHRKLVSRNYARS